VLIDPSGLAKSLNRNYLAAGGTGRAIGAVTFILVSVVNCADARAGNN